MELLLTIICEAPVAIHNNNPLFYSRPQADKLVYSVIRVLLIKQENNSETLILARFVRFSGITETE
jgi:hypothetical protein